MSTEMTLLMVFAGLSGIWAMLQLALLGMYNYQLYQLRNQPRTVQHQRLGGLLKIEALSISPHLLIDWLTEDKQIPVLPTLLVRNILFVLSFVTLSSGVITYSSDSPLSAVVTTSLGTLLVVIAGSFALTSIHILFTEVRLWWSDTDECERLYGILSNSDSDAFPKKF